MIVEEEMLLDEEKEIKNRILEIKQAYEDMNNYQEMK